MARPRAWARLLLLLLPWLSADRLPAAAAAAAAHPRQTGIAAKPSCVRGSSTALGQPATRSKPRPSCGPRRHRRHRPRARCRAGKRRPSPAAWTSATAPCPRALQAAKGPSLRCRKAKAPLAPPRRRAFPRPQCTEGGRRLCRAISPSLLASLPPPRPRQPANKTKIAADARTAAAVQGATLRQLLEKGHALLGPSTQLPAGESESQHSTDHGRQTSQQQRPRLTPPGTRPSPPERFKTQRYARGPVGASAAQAHFAVQPVRASFDGLDWGNVL